jgi:hypothetical protein
MATPFPRTPARMAGYVLGRVAYAAACPEPDGRQVARLVGHVEGRPAYAFAVPWDEALAVLVGHYEGRPVYATAACPTASTSGSGSSGSGSSGSGSTSGSVSDSMSVSESGSGSSGSGSQSGSGSASGSASGSVSTSESGSASGSTSQSGSLSQSLSGSAPSGSSGSGSLAGCCGFDGSLLNATFGGSLAPVGTLPLNYIGVDSYNGSTLACGSRTAVLGCTEDPPGSGVYYYTFAVTSTDAWVMTLHSCSPFLMTGSSPNSAAPCAGAATVTITE